ncbi:MAG: hypothetical protein GX556_01390 [Fibrobacter sp.]|nr:hypothetical protein [Fibrobacter sp.]
MSLPKNTSDTLSPYATVALCFSEGISNPEQVSFNIMPLFDQYYCTVSETEDTVFIVPSQPLPGNCRFVIRPEKEILSLKKERLSSDSVVFYTYPFEREPNNSFLTADSLPRKLFGALSTINDTDIFIVRDTSLRKFYITSHVSQTTFVIRNSSGNTTLERNFRSKDTLSAPSHFKAPLYLLVYPWRRSVGGHYDMGYIPGKTRASE